MNVEEAVKAAVEVALEKLEDSMKAAIDEFRKVSAGFFGVLAMLSAIDVHCELYEPPIFHTRRDQPLQIDEDALEKIHNGIVPHMRLTPMYSHQDSAQFGGSKKTLSRQLKSRDDDGVWHTRVVK